MFHSQSRLTRFFHSVFTLNAHNNELLINTENKLSMNIRHPPSALLFKPTEHIEAIIEKSAPFSDTLTIKKGELIGHSYKNKRVCYLIHEGSVTLHRRRDGMILNAEKSPFILGISNQLVVHSEGIYFRATEQVRMSRLPLERFNMLIESFGLWESLCKTLIYNISRLFEHYTISSRMSTNEIIAFQLQELIQETEQIRTSVTAANYILVRTSLSRSSIMRRLAFLRDTGAITLERGILVNLNSPENVPENAKPQHKNNHEINQ